MSSHVGSEVSRKVGLRLFGAAAGVLALVAVLAGADRAAAHGPKCGPAGQHIAYLAYNYPITATGCTAGAGAAKYGDVMTCSGFSSSLRAKWTHTVARENDSTGGCLFMCTSGDCFVGNNGLPVELLHFAVD